MSDKRALWSHVHAATDIMGDREQWRKEQALRCAFLLDKIPWAPSRIIDAQKEPTLEALGIMVTDHANVSACVPVSLSGGYSCRLCFFFPLSHCSGYVLGHPRK